MGTMIALLLVLSTLAGCAGGTMKNGRSAPPPPAEAPLLCAVELTSYAETLTDEAGETLAECAYQVPMLRVLTAEGTELEQAASPEEAQALEAAETFNAEFSGWTGHSQKLEDLKETALADRVLRGQESWEFFPYTDELTCTVYQTGHLVSVSGVYYTDTGGVHPNTMLLSWNFDLDSGNFFEPEQLDQGSGLREAVLEELLVQAERRAAENQMAPEDFFWSNYRDILKDWSSYAVFFDEAGMTVAFSPYELACYAAGSQTFHLPYEKLTPYLDGRLQGFLGLPGQGTDTEEAAEPL